MHEDKDIIEKTLSGEKEAFELLIRKYENPMFNYIGRMVRERELALELTQEVFLKSYASLHSYQTKYKFSTWLFKIASNLIIDYWRKKRIPALSLDQQDNRGYQKVSLQVSDQKPSITKKYELSELKARIEETLEEIPTPLKELFIWRHMNELSYAEIAEIKNIPVGTVKNRVFQAKEMILRLLEEKS
jgi:RNA polymerase sigma-70 factor (ECF subfamily)